MAIAKYGWTAIDCANPISLASFYASITGWDVEPLGEMKAEDVEWLEVRDNGIPRFGFQKVANYQAPTWPDGKIPQQMHIDFTVSDLDKAEKEVLALGAVKVEFQPGSTEAGERWRVYLDPEGHPFCLCLKTEN